jgi:ribosome recycling factor
MSENNKPKQRRGVTLRTPEDVRRLVQRIASKAFQEGTELEHAGRISQLLANWLKAWEMEKVSDIEKRIEELEIDLEKRRD